MTAKTQKRRKGTAIIFSKRLFFTLIVVCTCIPSSPIFSADTDEKEIVEQAVEEAVKKATKETIEDVAEKVSEEAVEEAEIRARRPDELKGATVVYFTVFVLDISDINDANQTFTANVYMRLRWKDERLANKEGEVRQIRLHKVWNPRVILANQLGRGFQSLPEIVRVHPDGTVIYHQRYTGRFSQPMQLADFPLDIQSFKIDFVATGYDEDELRFKPEFKDVAFKDGGSMAKSLSLSNWEILSYKAAVVPYKPIEELNTASFSFGFQAERYVDYYLWQVMLPLAVIVIMSSAAFWIRRKDLGIRVAVVTGSVLTLIAHRFVLASLLPQLPYMTRLDFFTVGCTILVLLALIIVVVTGSRFMEYKESLARNLDNIFRAGIPSMFLLFLIWFLNG